MDCTLALCRLFDRDTHAGSLLSVLIDVKHALPKRPFLQNPRATAASVERLVRGLSFQTQVNV
jgi:hypothetical protein